MAGIVLVLVGAVVFVGGFLHELNYMYHPQDEPACLYLIFPAAVIVAATGLLFVIGGVTADVVRRLRHSS